MISLLQPLCSLELLEVHVEVLGEVLHGDARKNSSIDG